MGDDQLDQCIDKSPKESKPKDIACGNQEIPDDLRNKNSQQAEARKLGMTPSSLDLPKINLADFDKWAVLNESKPMLPDENQCKPEPLASVPDHVIAYDEKGEAHKFINEPINQMPPNFSKVPDWRQKQLDQQSKDLIDKYAGTGTDRAMDFQKVSDMQKEIAQRKDLTETEKCLLYSKIQVTMRETEVKVENWNEKPEMVDSWTGEKDPWHAIAPMDDRYHNRLVNMTPEEATKAIQEQEDHTEGDMHESIIDRAMWKGARFVFGINQGDINASEGQLKCMREMRDKGTFAAYADAWEKEFVNKKGVNPHTTHPSDGAEGASGNSGQGGSSGTGY